MHLLPVLFRCFCVLALFGSTVASAQPVVDTPSNLDPAPLRQSVRCELRDSDAAWMEGVLGAWRTVGRRALHVDRGPLPWLIFFDETCVWHVSPALALPSSLLEGAIPVEAHLIDAQRSVLVRGFTHRGTLRLPDGSEAPPRLMSFTATYGANPERPYVVMAMPALWRADPRHGGEPGTLVPLTRSVFAHEMSHALQSPVMGLRLDEVSEWPELTNGLDDDIVQRRFEQTPGFREAYAAERDLLYRAAAEDDMPQRCAFAGAALRAMDARRARFFSGPDTLYAELEDIFLNMEGVANWVAYRVLLNGGMGEADALMLLRRGGRFWSQDLGLALFLVIDKLQGEWQRTVLADHPISVLQLLRSAIESKRCSAPGSLSRPRFDRLSQAEWLDPGIP